MHFDKAKATLEFDKILSLVAKCAPTEGAREAVLSAAPCGDIDAVLHLQAETTDAKRLLAAKGMPSFCGIIDVRPSIDRADKSAQLTPKELLDIKNLLSASRLVEEYGRSERTFETVLDEHFERLSPNRYLEDRIARSILAEDLIADEASPDLAEIRRKIRAKNNKIKEILRRYTQGNTYTKYLRDNIVTQRNGRYVVPVKSEYRSEIKGLLHDTSDTGATLFIEPSAVVEANNELRMLEGDEAKEIERILYELSSLVAGAGAVLNANYEILTYLGAVFARGEYSFRIKGVEPKINREKKIDIRRARHPLLSPDTVVPIHIEIGGSFDTLVITGPNTGGKTVSLKTLGLFLLMAQSGLHIPASEESEIAVFSGILSDIGDEQSIEQSLSTFSAHMVNIVNILKAADENSIVLLDELGAGTDPIEGAALAVSILEAIRKKGALCAATTHYAELKAYALETDGVCNASCEFDVESLKPTYKLIIGTPGRSNAFAISAKLGLDSDIIGRAKSLIAPDSKRFENVIDKLESTRVDMESEYEKTRQLRQELEALKAETEQRCAALSKEAEKELDDARNKARGMLDSARASSDYIFAQLGELRKKQDKELRREEVERAREDIRGKLKEADKTADPVITRKPKNYVLPRPLKIGDEVHIFSIGKSGVVKSLPDKNGNLKVACGALITTTNVKNLMLEDGKSKKAAGGKKTSEHAYSAPVPKTFKPEIDLRGENGEDAWGRVDKYFDDACALNFTTVTLIHGKGTGALKRALWERLRSDPRVSAYRVGAYGEGDLGVTVVELK